MTRKATSGDLPQQFHQVFEAFSKDGGRGFTSRMAWAALPEADRERAEAIMLFKKASFDRAFELGPTVWKNWDFVKDIFKWTTVEPTIEVDAALLVKGKTSAIGRSVLQRAESYKLVISHRAMKHTSAQLDKVLLHELVHMGYGGHGRDFRKICAEVGGAISGGEGITDPGTHVEKKIGARYKRVHTVNAVGPVGEILAKQWVFNEQRAMEARGEPRTNWRLSFG